MRWIDSKVGWFTAGKIYPFVTPLDLVRFSPLPLIDRAKLGMMGLTLRKRDDWEEFEHVTAKGWIEKNVSKNVFDKVWGPLLHGKYGEAYDEIAMAWLWSKIHLRFASRKGGPMQKEQLGYLMGSFALYIEELERRHILRVLETTGGNMTAAAKRLGVDRGTLHRKMQQWQGHGAQMGSA